MDCPLTINHEMRPARFAKMKEEEYMQGIVIYMTQAGKLNYDRYGQSFGYTEFPSFMDIPLLKVHFSSGEVQVHTDKRGVARLQKMI